MVVDFRVIALRFFCRGRRELNANYLRGQLGKSLRELDRELYDRFFEPKLVEGPSGLRNAPRPFVVRVAGGEHFCFHLFDPRQAIQPIVDAVKMFLDVEPVETEIVTFSLEPRVHAGHVRVRFATPTELKGAIGGTDPTFDLLFGRIRDRISTLRALYQDGPLEIDFKALGARAARVKMTRCEIQYVADERTSRTTGQTHSLGGFTGVAEYEGDLGEFLPYLELAHWTGVGRQTVWGKGEIVSETF